MKALFFAPQSRLRNGWWILIFFLVLAGLVVPATSFAASRQLTVPPGIQALMALVATALCAWLRRERLSRVMGPLRSWPVGVATGIAMGFSIWALTSGVLWVTGAVTWRLNANAMTALHTGVVACLGVAVTEELIFRGFVFQRLLDGVGAGAAQIAMAGYFLLTHWGNPGMTGSIQPLAASNILLASLMLGIAYLRTRSLALPIALHFMLNFTQGSLLGFGVSGTATHGALVPHLGGAPAWWTGGAFGLEASLPGTIAILAATIALTQWRPTHALDTGHRAAAPPPTETSS